ncbi:MAG: GWxTD domain-containing protein, partial [Gemmatimonas sp.]
DVGRVLSIRESARHAEMPDSTRDRFDALFWSVGDPSLLIPGNVFRSEHLARVVHADLRWSNEEEGVRGAISDRGDALIRFGPPDIRASFKFGVETGPNVVWAWTPLKLHLFFQQLPLYGTALMNQTYRSEIFDPVTFTNPSFFGTLPGVVRGRDTLLVQAARFRGAGDSADVAVFAGLRNNEKKAPRFDGADNTQFGVFSLSPTGAVLSRFVRTIPSVRRDALPDDDVLLRAQIAPGGSGLRVDALREHDMSVARWMTDLTSTMTRGFSISDLIVTERATLKSATATGARWTDFDIQPNPANTFSRKRPIDLLWEIYELSPSVNGNQYRLSITLQREDGKGAGAVFARVIGMAAGAVGVASRDRNSISLTYDRAVPASLTIAETVRLDLSSAPTGRYQVSISVLDKSSGRTERTVRAISIVD